MSYSLFSVAGVELEYMIVDRATLQVRPIADALIHAVTGQYTADVDRGAMAWSNELVNHVLEVKTNGPAPTLVGLAEAFHAEVRWVNKALAALDAMLLPTGAHPFMDPVAEMQLWPHEYNEVYALYNRIFDCRGHGWANLQSTHLNLPFADDAEFERLHAAVRVLLPLLPALSASTPVLDGRLTGFADSRLEAYRHNQARLPVLSGEVIPEPVFTRAAYHEAIFAPINAAIRPFDTEGILDHHFLNSRGAIARFDRGAIEIRVLDLQECPAADLALLELITAVLRALVGEAWTPRAQQKAQATAPLAALFRDVIRTAEQTSITDATYLALFGLDGPATAHAVWSHLADAVRAELSADAAAIVDQVLAHGTLATRLTQHLGDTPDADAIRTTYRALADCLAENRLFLLKS